CKNGTDARNRITGRHDYGRRLTNRMHNGVWGTCFSSPCIGHRTHFRLPAIPDKELLKIEETLRGFNLGAYTIVGRRHNRALDGHDLTEMGDAFRKRQTRAEHFTAQEVCGEVGISEFEPCRLAQTLHCGEASKGFVADTPAALPVQPPGKRIQNRVD